MKRPPKEEHFDTPESHFLDHSYYQERDKLMNFFYEHETLIRSVIKKYCLDEHERDDIFQFFLLNQLKCFDNNPRKCIKKMVFEVPFLRSLVYKATMSFFREKNGRSGSAKNAFSKLKYRNIDDYRLSEYIVDSRFRYDKLFDTLSFRAQNVYNNLTPQNRRYVDMYCREGYLLSEIGTLNNVTEPRVCQVINEFRQKLIFAFFGENCLSHRKFTNRQLYEVLFED
ncbi:MAG: hypothetical protein P1V18_04740 [Candidatus Gracilibacteria bacterium]|nr:hypothetical protein [Candidatus Gracilibacteria bacterium]